ncbi:MAG: coenzyme F420-0:L-glutamate ligase [Methanocellales archaeon]|nr:coenzyme F420-0:L-glutamate ligase [Methanocellales archaeon]MDI6903249.1 coenzyme F420-0:L-glutamate ligase [Methanocellales archaeon]
MTLYPLKTPLIRPGDDLAEVMVKVLEREKLRLEDGDVIVIAESVVATSQGRLQKLDQVNPSDEARRMAKKYDLDPRIVEVILQEADEVYGGVKKVLLTQKDGWFVANAGVDSSNAPDGYVVLLPKEPHKAAERIRKDVEKKAGKKIGIIIGDSRAIPLKRGVIGVALAAAGIEPVEDVRGRRDLFGRKLQVTFRAIADDLVSAAQLLMGEADEQSPMVLIRGAPIEFTEEPQQEMNLSPEECMYMNVFQRRLAP